MLSFIAVCFVDWVDCWQQPQLNKVTSCFIPCFAVRPTLKLDALYFVGLCVFLEWNTSDVLRNEIWLVSIDTHTRQRGQWRSICWTGEWIGWNCCFWEDTCWHWAVEQQFIPKCLCTSVRIIKTTPQHHDSRGLNIEVLSTITPGRPTEKFNLANFWLQHSPHQPRRIGVPF